MNDIIIIDDVVDRHYQNQIEQLTLADHNATPWFFQSDLTFPDIYFDDLLQKDPTSKIVKRPGFSHMVYDTNLHIGSSYNFYSPLLYSACNGICSIKNLTQIRMFLSIPVHGDIHKIDNPHVDKFEPHMVGLYYINDSDGDTVIFDKQFNYGIDEPWPCKTPATEIPILKTITPKKGRFVLFNGNRYHASSQPLKSPRAVINFNFLSV
jgi:hypothetical protein